MPCAGAHVSETLHSYCRRRCGRMVALMSDRRRKVVRTVLLITAEIALVLITWGLIYAIMYPAQVGSQGR